MDSITTFDDLATWFATSSGRFETMSQESQAVVMAAIKEGIRRGLLEARARTECDLAALTELE